MGQKNLHFFVKNASIELVEGSKCGASRALPRGIDGWGEKAEAEGRGASTGPIFHHCFEWAAFEKLTFLNKIVNNAPSCVVEVSK